MGSLKKRAMKLIGSVAKWTPLTPIGSVGLPVLPTAQDQFTNLE